MKPQQTGANMLKINEIFNSFQSEGIYANIPATFIRLSGCNLNCNFCDTNFNDYFELDIKDIKINNPLLVITGGEPLLQYKELKKLIKKITVDYIQIETNGTIQKPILPITYVISPKNNIENIFNYYKDYDNTYFKFIIKNKKDLQEIETILNKNNYTDTIWLQPEYNHVNTIIKEILNYKPKINYKLSFQTHKYVGVL